MNTQQHDGSTETGNGYDRTHSQPNARPYQVPKGYTLKKRESWLWYKVKLVMFTVVLTAVTMTMLYIALVIGVVAATTKP